MNFDEAVSMAADDLNAYWSVITTTYTPVGRTVPFSSAGAPNPVPKCGDVQYTDEEAAGTAFFCIDDNYVAWDTDMLEGVSTDIGDFGVAAVLAQPWTASFQHQNGQIEEQINSKQGSLQRACFTGSWTRAVWDGDAHNDGSFTLSPGDLDEAVQAFLAFSETPDDKGQTAGGSAFEQIAAFRDGFLTANGAQQCATYSEADAKGDKN